MIVFYNKPNIMVLPYVCPDDKIVKFFTFVPGENKLPNDVWVSIKKKAGSAMDYYNTLLKVFKPVIDKETNEEVGLDESDIDYSNLTVNEMSDVVENTMAKDKLINLLNAEKKRQKPRTTVKKIINDKLRQIDEIEEALKK